MEETGDYSVHAARQFAEKYKTATSEKSLAQSFWRDFFHLVFGIDDLLGSGIEFEHPVRSASTGQTNFIDVFWSGVVLIEHKSAGKDLDLAEKQARDYLVSLAPVARPPALVICDFAHFRIVEVLAGQTIEFPLAELPDHLHRFASIFGDKANAAARPEVSADAKAAELMSELYVEFEKAGYTGHQVSVFLVRVLFLNFGDDTRMWKRIGHGLFATVVENSPESGSGLGATIQELFQVLDTPKDTRPKTLSAELEDFPYVNGGLFTEQLPVFSFTPAMRLSLLNAAYYDWSKISPAIFGSMFQTVKSKEDRRELGEHYTSEANILKVIRPLFLDDYLDKLHKAWDNAAALKRLRLELGQANYLDPAAGSGNFLVVSYKRLREIELKILARLHELENTFGQLQLDGSFGLQVRLSQFHAIEYEEWSSQIARVAMFLADHQANLALEEITGATPNRFPLTESAVIRHGNALTTDWSEVCPMNENTFIMGNPPFYGSSLQNAEQKSETQAVWKAIAGAGTLDYVANWFLLAAQHSAKSGARAAFVSTNSITQGEQPAVIWGQLYPLGVGIDFAHRTFAWDNDASGKAAVHVVIVGLSAKPKPNKRPLWVYKSVKDTPELLNASNINGYLLDAPNILVSSRTNPLRPETQKMEKGNIPTDGGYLSNISAEEAFEIRNTDPVAAKYLRRLIGARELIHNEERYCLWLLGADPQDLRTSTTLASRIKEVRLLREASPKKMTQKDANRPAEFQEIRQPKTDYIVVPLHSSEDREYVPIGRMSPEVIVNNAVAIVADGSLTTFGLLMSKPFNVWNKAVSGRLESRVRISNTITYNNFPFPEITEANREKVVQAAQAVLDARAKYPSNSLADLYNRDGMPGELRQAHNKLDAAVLTVLGLKADASEERILARLFELYDELTRGLLDAQPVKKTRKKPEILA
ncbi:MAG: DNA methyltransferase [Aurantimicrobium sp.]